MTPVVWRCAECNHPHHHGMPNDGCDSCGWADDFDWYAEQLRSWAL